MRSEFLLILLASFLALTLADTMDLSHPNDRTDFGCPKKQVGYCCMDKKGPLSIAPAGNCYLTEKLSAIKAKGVSPDLRKNAYHRCKEEQFSRCDVRAQNAVFEDRLVDRDALGSSDPADFSCPKKQVGYCCNDIRATPLTAPEDCVHTKKLHGEKTAPLPDGQHSWQRCKKGQFSRCAVNTPVGSLVDRDALHQFPRKPFGCFELKQKGYCCKSKDTPLNECRAMTRYVEKSLPKSIRPTHVWEACEQGETHKCHRGPVS